MRNIKKRDKAGVTLIELLMVIVIVGVLVGVSSMYIKETIGLWSFITFRNEIVGQSRLALTRMIREIRQIKNVSSVYIARQQEFRFIDVKGNNVYYKLSGNNLIRNYNNRDDTLASGVTGLKFTYYNASGAEIANPICYPQETDICSININLTLQSGSQKKTLSAQVYIRNV